MPAKFSAVEAAAKRDEILDAVAPVFADRGYEATTVSDLEAATGLSRGGIFFHFASKRDLYVAAIRHTSLRRGPMLREAALSGQTTLDVMLRTFDAFMRENEEHPEYRKFLQQIRANRGSQPDLVELYAEMDRQQYEYYAGICVDLQRRSLLNPDLDPESVARVFAALVDHLYHCSFDMPQSELREQGIRLFRVLEEGAAVR